MTEARLTESDVHKLLADPSGETRADTAAKLAIQFDQGNLSPSERAMAEQIFRIMVKDTEVRVLEALAINLKENPNVPHDVAVTLAKDVDQVALPVLRFSEILSDDDLQQIVRSQDMKKQKAIAGRAHVSAVVADAIVEDADEDAVVTLVSNEGAELTEKSLDRVIDKYGQDEDVQKPMVARSVLPVTIVERLVHQVSENLCEHLLAHHEMLPSIATDLILQARERATIGAVHRFVRRRRGASGQPALQQRSFDAFDHSAGVVHGRHEVLRIRDVPSRRHSDDERADADPRFRRAGAKRPLQQVGDAREFLPAVKSAISVAKEMSYDGEEGDRERYARRMLERVLTQYGDLGVDFDKDDLEYLLTKMNNLPATSH